EPHDAREGVDHLERGLGRAAIAARDQQPAIVGAEIERRVSVAAREPAGAARRHVSGRHGSASLQGCGPGKTSLNPNAEGGGWSIPSKAAGGPLLAPRPAPRDGTPLFRPHRLCYLKNSLRDPLKETWPALALGDRLMVGQRTLTPPV